MDMWIRIMKAARPCGSVGRSDKVLRHAMSHVHVRQQDMCTGMCGDIVQILLHPSS